MNWPDAPPPEIFKAYDIRGIVDETLTEEGVARIGQAIGTEALARGSRSVAIGRDGRLSGPRLAAALS
ncbi:MAG: phosphomannomutase/phosphoglucomutase, partial [bacterium]